MAALNASYWTYRAPVPPEFSDLPAGAFAGTAAEWGSLSPGYRREIARTFAKLAQEGTSRS